MEPMGVVSDVEWSNEEADFIAHFVRNFQGTNEVDGIWNGYGSTTKMAEVGDGSYNSTNVANNTNFYCFSQGSNYSDGIMFSSSNDENYYLSDSHPILVTNYSTISMDSCMENVNNGGSYFIGGNDFPSQEKQESVFYPKMNLQLKRESSDKSKKRSRDSKDHVQKNKRSTIKTLKNQKLMKEEETNANHIGQTSSSCSEDDSNVSHEPNGGVSSSSKEPASLNLKTRASRGSATDPQSLYARKRRERINERLRILQNLIPNGTKVDISTMLDEAVQYVKFLQLQIKLLSSEDLWMYAPIAYNGKDIGLDLKISMSKNS